MIIKKVPNAINLYIVYDPLDRVVLVQDGNMRANNKWYYTKYDNENRTIVEGLYTDATHTTFNDGTSTDIQVYVNGLSCYGSSSTTYYELRTTGTSSWYTNNCFPTSGTEERMYFYYDDYDFDNSGSADYSYTAQGMTGEQSSGATNKTLGLPTGIKKKILGTSNWLISYTFYDKWYHPIQTIGNNELKLTTVTDMKTQVVDISGRITATRTYKSHAQGSGFTITVNNTYTYDKMSRLLEVRQTNNSEAEVIVAHYEYNALGQLVDKKLHSTNSGSSYLQSIDLRYNIRGQLASINNSTLTGDGGVTNDDNDDLFGMELLYDNTDASLGNNANYTGLLSAVKWKANPPSGGNTDTRAYLFSYDKLNRLTGAAYKALTIGFSPTWTKDLNGFNENITYDWNGNIMTLQRNAIVTGYSGAQQIDNLTYDYGTNNDNNQLLNVTENSTNANAGLGFNSSSSSSYIYDDNGNLITDPKKGTTITYNEMDKPVQVINSISQSISYEYDAAGVRISKTTSSGGLVKKLYYLGDFVFNETYALSYFMMPEGRNRPGAHNTYTYEYFITDQQGNVRVSFDAGLAPSVVKQENSYYPFGMIMPGAYTPTAPNKFLYNAGSEWQDDYSIANYYSTPFREYDPILGRFNSIDPLADLVDDESPFHYSGNNPVNLNDPSGALVPVQLQPYYKPLPEVIVTGVRRHSHSVGFRSDIWYEFNSGLELPGTDSWETGGWDGSGLISGGGGGSNGGPIPGGSSGGWGSGGGGGHHSVVGDNSNSSAGGSPGYGGPVNMQIFPQIGLPIFTAEALFSEVEEADLEYYEESAPPEQKEISLDPSIVYLKFQALRGKNDNRDESLQNFDAPEGGYNGFILNRHETPYAATLQGGALARSKLVDAWQNQAHGRALSQFYRLNNINTGDWFLVPLRISRRRPIPIPVPVVSTKPIKKPQIDYKIKPVTDPPTVPVWIFTAEEVLLEWGWILVL